MGDALWKRLLRSSGWSLLGGRVVLTSDMLEEWLGLAVQSTDRVGRIGVDFTDDRARIGVEIRALKATFLVESVLRVEDAALDAERFYLRLGIVQKPKVVEDPPSGETTFEQALEALGGAALKMMSVETLIRLIGSAAQPIVQGEGDELLIDFDAIDPVREIFDRERPIGRLRDALTLKSVDVAAEGLVLRARIHVRHMLKQLFSARAPSASHS